MLGASGGDAAPPDAPPQVWHPAEMNACFARAFNSRRIEHLLVLYEDDAVLRTDAAAEHRGLAAIRAQLTHLLALPGTMASRNNFCIAHGDGLALLRADWALQDAPGTVLARGGSAELVRRQRDGSWRYLIDHAGAVDAPSVLA